MALPEAHFSPDFWGGVNYHHIRNYVSNDGIFKNIRHFSSGQDPEVLEALKTELARRISIGKITSVPDGFEDIFEEFENEDTLEEFKKIGQIREDVSKLKRDLKESGVPEDKITYVSGCVISRENPETRQTEYLISNEAKADGSDKPWANQPGGTVEYSKDGRGIEKHENAMLRELREEIGLDVGREDLIYVGSYVPHGSNMIISAFMLKDPDTFLENIKEVEGMRLWWTQNPLELKMRGMIRGKDRELKEGDVHLTEQSDYTWRMLGFDGPKGKNTAPERYFGVPGQEYTGKLGDLNSSKLTNDFLLKEFQQITELKGEELEQVKENGAFLDYYRELESEFLGRVMNGEISLDNVNPEYRELFEQLLVELGPEIISENRELKIENPGPELEMGIEVNDLLIEQEKAKAQQTTIEQEKDKELGAE